jgi:predicted dehydrogenase
VSEEAIVRLSNRWPLPTQPRPIVILGVSGIINEAHLPAYRKGELPVIGVFDLGPERSKATAERFGIPQVFTSLSDAVSQEGAVFDVAVPPEQLYDVLAQLPPGATALMQKPMGRDLDEARRIRQLCRDRGLIAAVNFQFRFSPMMLAIRDALRRDLLGDLVNVEIQISTWTPWHQFSHLRHMPRLEILLHSIHYLDWIRAILGNPKGVYARTLPQPDDPELKNTRSSILLNYGERTRCCLSINHNYEFGPRHQAARVRVEGTKGAAFGTLGLLLNYPEGEPDQLEITTEGTDWIDVPLEGEWFPDAFVGPMANLQRYAAGEDRVLLTSVEDSYYTMALVEACYQSDATGGTPLPE